MRVEDVAIIGREVTGTLIPYGDAITLVPGTEVLITQSKGGSFTLHVNGNLVRIEGRDADAIGKEIELLPSERLHLNDRALNREEIEQILWDQLATCYDPEIPVNIVALGLIYQLNVTEVGKDQFHVGIQMTLTAPGCGMGPVLTAEVEKKARMVPGVTDVDVVLVFDPPWNSDRMSEDAKLELGLL